MNSNASPKHSFSFGFSLFNPLAINLILCLLGNIAYILNVQASCLWLGNSPFGLLLLFSLHKVIKLNGLLSLFFYPNGGAALLADECSFHYFASPSGPHIQPVSIYKEREPRYCDSLDTYI